MSPKTILSLFDHSGAWSAPFLEAGHNVIHIDLKHNATLHDVAKFDVTYFFETLGIEWVDAIIAAPPCTDFTNAGAQYWGAKDADGRTAASAHLVEQVLRCVEFWKPDWWVMENPVGRLPKIIEGLGRPVMHFIPSDFGGWVALTATETARLAELNEAAPDSFTKADIALIKKANAYTKKTALWGNFTLPTLKPIAPIKVCAAGSWLMKLGGKGAATKEARSVTPDGFAEAFYAANEWTPAYEAAVAIRREFAEENGGDYEEYEIARLAETAMPKAA